MTKLQYVRVDCMLHQLISCPCSCLRLFVLTACQLISCLDTKFSSCLLLNSIQQLPIKTGIFDPPSLSSAKWNSLSALLGLAG